MLQELELYAEEKRRDGKVWDGNVPTNYKIVVERASGGRKTEEEKNLGRWVNRQRSLYQAGKLKKERQIDLERVGLKWSVLLTASWQTMYECLCNYAKERRAENNGIWDGNVPTNHKVDSRPPVNLGRWINRQRSAYAKGRLKPEYVTKLDQTGLKWSMHDQRRSGLDYDDDDDFVGEEFLPKSGTPTPQHVPSSNALRASGVGAASAAPVVRTTSVPLRSYPPAAAGVRATPVIGVSSGPTTPVGVRSGPLPVVRTATPAGADPAIPAPATLSLATKLNPAAVKMISLASSPAVKTAPSTAVNTAYPAIPSSSAAKPTLKAAVKTTSPATPSARATHLAFSSVAKTAPATVVKATSPAIPSARAVVKPSLAATHSVRATPLASTSRVIAAAVPSQSCTTPDNVKDKVVANTPPVSSATKPAHKDVVKSTPAATHSVRATPLASTSRVIAAAVPSQSCTTPANVKEKVVANTPVPSKAEV
jgi:hypothetical protein